MGIDKKKFEKNRRKKSLKEKVRKQKIHIAKVHEKNETCKLNNEIKDIRKDLAQLNQMLDLQMRYLNNTRIIGIKVYKFIDTLVSKRLDLSYLTDEIKNNLKQSKEDIIHTTDTITRLQQTTLGLLAGLPHFDKDKTPTNAVEKLMLDIQKYTTLFTKTTEIVQLTDNVTTFNRLYGRILSNVYQEILKADTLREEMENYEAIMPIISKEEREDISKLMGLDPDKFIDKYKDTNFEADLQYLKDLNLTMNKYTVEVETPPVEEKKDDVKVIIGGGETTVENTSKEEDKEYYPTVDTEAKVNPDAPSMTPIQVPSVFDVVKTDDK